MNIKSDSFITYKSVIIFALLTVLNISVFVFMIFENQMELIFKNAELESKDIGIQLKTKITDVIEGRDFFRGKQKVIVAAGKTELFSEASRQSKRVGTAAKDSILSVTKIIPPWYGLKNEKGEMSWVAQQAVIPYYPTLLKGKFDPEDIKIILKEIDLLNIEYYTIFLEDGYVLYDNTGRKEKTASAEEAKVIKQTIFKNSFENLIFYHEIDKEKREIKLYIPIYYAPNQVFVIKPVVQLKNIETQIRYLFRQILLMAVLIISVHAAFVILNQRLIIFPMVKDRTQRLEEKNKVISEAKAKLEETLGILNEELEMAREIQAELIPKSLPSVDGFRFAYHYQPTEKVGGDFFDLIKIREKNLGIVLADASGHGIPAAFLTVMAKMSFVQHAEMGETPKNLLTKTNQQIYANVSKTENYLTAFYGELDPSKKTLKFSRASHPPGVLFRKQEKKVELLTTMGLFIGMLEDGRYEEKEILLHSGDRIILHTDGFNEALNDKREPYGYNRIYDSVIKHGEQNAEGLLAGLLEDFDQYYHSLTQNDDIAIAVIEVV